MNTIMKTALGALMLGGAALAGTAPANAAVIGVTVGVPGVAVGMCSSAQIVLSFSCTRQRGPSIAACGFWP